jgi:hypothetical protein
VNRFAPLYINDDDDMAEDGNDGIDDANNQTAEQFEHLDEIISIANNIDNRHGE